eukprot:77506-Pelagomonas_calceolata.AAC.1
MARLVTSVRIAQSGHGAFVQAWNTFASQSLVYLNDPGCGQFLAGVVLLLTSSLPLILRSTRCEEGVCGLLGSAGQGVTNIASGQLELRLAWSGILGSKSYGGIARSETCSVMCRSCWVRRSALPTSICTSFHVTDDGHWLPESMWRALCCGVVQAGNASVV